MNFIAQIFDANMRLIPWHKMDRIEGRKACDYLLIAPKKTVGSHSGLERIKKQADWIET